MDGLRIDVAVIGGGQAGLAASYCLSERGIEHVVLERNSVGWDWRERRWDSFCLVTPNWQCVLPGFAYDGPDPDGFMNRDEVVCYLERYAEATNPPLVEGVAVQTLQRRPDRDFELVTTSGHLRAGQVVIATGPYNEELVPDFARLLEPEIVQLHSSQYRRAEDLPPGDVLVVGTGQSGAQLAEDLHRAGRRVHLSVGGAPRVARRYRGKDVVAWLDEMGYYTKTVEQYPLKQDARHNVNHYVTGRDGGHDIDLRAFALEGMELYGRLADVRGDVLHFRDDLEHNLDRADAVSESIKDSIDVYIAANGITAASERRYEAPWRPPGGGRRLDLRRSGTSSVVWATGFRSDYGWVHLPVFAADGRPVHHRGVTDVEGAYFLGLPWLYTWGSGRFSGVGADAAHLAEVIGARVAERPGVARTA